MRPHLKSEIEQGLPQSLVTKINTITDDISNNKNTPKTRWLTHETFKYRQESTFHLEKAVNTPHPSSNPETRYDSYMIPSCLKGEDSLLLLKFGPIVQDVLPWLTVIYVDMAPA